MTRRKAVLFEWLDLLAVATGRKTLKGPTVAVALFMALDSRSTSGEDATVDAERLAIELDCSTRQVWRHVQTLVEGGWIERTEAPVRGQRGKPGTGRKARYRLTLPSLNLSLHTGEIGGSDGVTGDA